MAYIANKWNSAQITNIHYWDSVGGAWSGNLVGAATPFALLPNPVNANDFVIFGIDTSVLDSGPFNSLVFDIQVPNVATIVWKYSDAGGGVLPTAWAVQGGLQDNTKQDGLPGGVAFDTVGIRSVSWAVDPLWIVQNPTVGGVALGVTGYWICADVTGGAGGAPPTQTNRDIYTVAWGAIELAQPGGDLQTLPRFRFHEEDGNNKRRIIVGLRKTSRGADFRSYLNFAQAQNPATITVVPAGPGAWQADVTVPAGETIRVTNPPAVGAGAAVISIPTPLSNQYRGTFRAFIRAMQLAGAAGVIKLQLELLVGDTIVTDQVHLSDIKSLQGVATWEAIDVGRVSVPGYAGIPTQSSLDWQVTVYGDGVEDCDLMDLVLIPTDEWAADIYANSLQLGGRGTVGIEGYYADIDSISYPKQRPFPANYSKAGGQRLAEPRLIRGTGGLIPNAIQRIYMLTISGSLSGVQASWPEHLESFESWQVQRYSSMRGAR